MHKPSAKMLSSCVTVAFLYPRHVAPIFFPLIHRHVMLIRSLIASIVIVSAECREPTMSVRACAGICLSSALDLLFAPKPTMHRFVLHRLFRRTSPLSSHDRSLWPRCTREARKGVPRWDERDECVSRLVSSAAVPRFGQHRVAKSSRKICADVIDRRHSMLVQFSSCGDGTSQPSWSLTLCLNCLRRFGDALCFC